MPKKEEEITLAPLLVVKEVLSNFHSIYPLYKNGLDFFDIRYVPREIRIKSRGGGDAPD